MQATTLRTCFLQGLRFSFILGALYVALLWMLNGVQLQQNRLALYTMPGMQKTGGQEQRMMRDYKVDVEYDILVLGSSHAYRGYDPREFKKAGFEVFNSGTSAQNIVGTYAMVRHFLSVKPTQLVILDLYDRMFEIEALEGTLRLTLNSTKSSVSRELAFHNPAIRVWNAHLSRPFIDPSEPEAILEDYIGNGYCSKSDTLLVVSGVSKQKCYVKERYIKMLDQLLLYLLSKGCKVVCVSHPQVVLDGLATYHASFVNVIEPVLTHYKVQYIDLTFHPAFAGNTYFADENHLNQSGVNLFNRVLIDSLTRKGALRKP